MVSVRYRGYFVHELDVWDFVVGVFFELSYKFLYFLVGIFVICHFDYYLLKVLRRNFAIIVFICIFKIN